MKGVILAAGEGTRLRRVTYGAIPKELLPIGNIPTIRFPLETMRLAGIKHIYVTIAPKTKHNILDALQSGRDLGVNICYLVQEKNEKRPAGIGLAILSVKPWIRRDEDFVVACGDSIVCDLSSQNPFACLQSALEVHKIIKPFATIMVYPTSFNPTRFGVAKLKQLNESNGATYGDIEKLVEKPSLHAVQKFKTGTLNYIITGYYIFSHKIFPFIEKTKPDRQNEVQITDSLELAIRDGERIIGVIHGPLKGARSCEVYYWDVGDPEDYKKANIRLSKLDLSSLTRE